MTTPAEREAAVRKLRADRPLAHRVLFPHRHPSADAPFHAEIIGLYHDTGVELAVVEAFRGSAKTTLGEEAVVIRAGFREFRNCLIVGASEERAMERLESVKHEIEANEEVLELFGDIKGGVWSGHKVVTASDAMIQARGVGQSLRGLKYRQWRPDYVLIDDFEDEDSVKTPPARAERLGWLYRTLLPALAPNAVVRVIGNRLDDDAVIVQIAKDPAWKHLRFPIRYKDLETGEWRPSWPSRFPMEKIEESRERYRRVGLIGAWDQEFMCEADAPEDRLFRPEMIVVKPRVHAWQSTWSMLDPARTTNRRSATSALPVWSYLGAKIVVWDCPIGQWMPDEMIDKMFEIDAEYRPAVMGVERDALDEFILQPLRQAQLTRGRALPIRSIAAPQGKIDFIGALQPFFGAREVEFAKDLPELRAQLLSFPKGRIDGPNALAYALKMRPGAAIYSEFGQHNIVEDIDVAPGEPVWLAMNATQGYVTAILLQWTDALHVIADWAEEGDPGQVAGRIVQKAALDAGRPIRCVAPPPHFERWGNVGLKAAVAAVPATLRQGRDPLAGREYIRGLFQRQINGLPTIQVAHRARWTLNAFAGGYARAQHKGGKISEHAEEGAYRILMEGLESFMGLLDATDDKEHAGAVNWATTEDGRRYISAHARR